MKTLKKLIFSVLFLLPLLTACDEREYDIPNLPEPKSEWLKEGKEMTPIRTLLNTFKGKALASIDDEIYIQGIITANDISGNIYKQIQIQDASGGINIRIDASGLNGTLRVGQEIVLSCQGLYYGEYHDFPQLGDSVSKAIGVLSLQKFKKHSQKEGFPNISRVVVPSLELKNLSLSVEESRTETERLIGQLVTVDKVFFEQGGKELFGDDANRLLKAEGTSNSITARMSSYADFASKMIPKGTGSVTGILTRYGNTLQMLFRDYDDCHPDRFLYIGSGTVADPYSINFTLEHQTDNTSGWIEGYIVGATKTGNPITGNGDIDFTGASKFSNLTVVLAQTADVKDWTKVVVIQLPQGSEIYSQVNLADHPENIGRVLKVNGNLGKVLGAAGLVTDGAKSNFKLEGVVTPAGQLIFNETFGTPPTASPFPSVAEYTGYVTTGAGAAQVSYTTEGSVSVRGNAVSSGYTGASGAGNAMMAAGGASLLINDIATCGATSLNLSFGSNEANSILSVAYKINGTSTWVAIPHTKASGWGLAEDMEINLPAGTNTIKLKFTAATTQYGTRVDDIKITTTNTIGAPIITPDGAVSEGTGTKADPYSIKFALANQGGDKFGWIDGYIVGAVAPGFGPGNSITSNAGISFTPPFLVPGSIVLAQTKNENDWTKVVVVELPAGTDIREIDLATNADNLGKKLKVNGTLKKVWGAAGLVTDGAKANFEIEGGSTTTGGLLLNETFGTPPTASPFPTVAEYTGYITTGAGAAQVKYTTEGGAVSVRGNATSSGYTGASGAGNAMLAANGASLLVNDIATCGATSLNLSFGSNETNATLAVAYKINGTSNWVPISYTKATATWELVSDLKINLPGGTNTIKLKFTAGTTSYGTRVDDITITTTNTIGTPIITPDEGGSEPPEPGDGDSSSAAYTVEKGISYQGSFGTTQKWVKGYIVGCVKNGKTTVSSAADIFIGVNSGWDSATNVIIADTPNETNIDKCIIVNLPAGKPLRQQVNLVDNPTAYQKSLTVKGVLRTYFGKAGLRDMTGETTDFIFE